jgi:transcriptional repressor NrdR
VPSHEVGLAILGPLRDLDEVAYLRFASVYRGFESLDDFEKAITELRGRRLPDGGGGDDGVHRAHDG